MAYSWAQARAALAAKDMERASLIITHKLRSVQVGHGLFQSSQFGQLELLADSGVWYLVHQTGSYPLTVHGYNKLRKRLRPPTGKPRKRNRPFDINDWI